MKLKQLPIIILFLFATFSVKMAKANNADDVSTLAEDQVLLEQNLSFQIDGQLAADTYFQEIPAQNPNYYLNESFVSLSMAYQERVRAVLTANLGSIIDLENVAFNENVDIEKFVREAYIELRHINNIPVAILIGKQPISFGQNIQEMPAWALGPLRGLQEIREVYGITMTLTESLIGLFDQIDYSIYEQDRGDLRLGKINGHNLRLTKYLNEQILLTIGAQKEENQLNQQNSYQGRIGLVGVNKNGKYIGWAEGIILTNDPQYPESHLALTIGSKYEFYQNSFVVAELNFIQHEILQLGIGLKTLINKTLMAGIDFRVTQNLAANETDYFLGFNLTYYFNLGTNTEKNQGLILFEDDESMEDFILEDF